MALTAEQKEANKQKRLARDRAFRDRRRLLEAAMETALAPFPRRKEDINPKVAPAQCCLDAWAADAKLDEAHAAIRAEEAQIRAQIAELQERLAGLRGKYDTSTLAQVRSKGYDAINAARKGAEAAVEAQFPDVAGIHSAAAWGAKNGYGDDSE